MQAWEQFLKLQEIELGKETVDKWLRTLKIQRFDARNLYLEAKDSFHALWFEEHIRSKVLTQFHNGNNKKIKIHLSIANGSPVSPLKEKRKRTQLPPFQLSFDEIDPHCRFENFIVEKKNLLTYKVLTECAGIEDMQPGNSKFGSFNPIYIYGGSGSGKTHLLMSLTHSFRSKGLKSIYARAETFTDHVVAAIRAGEMKIFRQAYRNVDVLLLDDVHVFSRKGATQEEFFHTFNTLHLDGKQIILTANCIPQELQLIEPRLISRFEWGIVLPLEALKAEEMKKLLEKKADALQFPLPPKIVDFFVETFTSNPKALTKALEALILRIHLDSSSLSALSIPSVKMILSDLIQEEQKAALTPNKIVQAVAEHYKLPIEDVLKKSQTRECVLARQLAMHICRTQLKLPFMKIGDLFSRDHSTVMTSIKQIQKGLDQGDCPIHDANKAILKKLKG